MTTAQSAGPGTAETPDTFEQLIGDCRRMAAHWKTTPPAGPQAAPAGLHGITVPLASAHAVSGMAEYGA